MKIRNYLAAATFVLATAMFAAPRVEAFQRGAVIVEWDQLAQQNLVGPPFGQVRTYAMLHIAMADAVIAVKGRFEPYHVHVAAANGASANAAAAQAGHDILVALVPTGAATFDSALKARLDKIDPDARSKGVQVGKKVAAKVLEWRQNDGSATANPQPSAYLSSVLPGIWRQTVSGSPLYSEWGSADTFGLLTPTQFLPSPYPQLESSEYAKDFNEVKSKGSLTSSTRTADETRTAQLWAGAGAYANVTNPLRLWLNVGRDLSEQKALSLVATARLFALLSVALHDSLQTAHVSKFVYRLWRPETAIDQAGVDNNPDTAAEPGWCPCW